MAQRSLGSHVAQVVGDTILETIASNVVGSNNDNNAKTTASTRPDALTPEQMVEDVLGDTETFVMKQKLETLEVLTNAAVNFLGLGLLCGDLTETTPKYETFALVNDNDNSKGRRLLLTAVEESEYRGWTGRCLCRPHHQLQLRISTSSTNQGQQQLMQWNRGCKWAWCVSCCNECRQELTVHYVDKDRNQTPLSQPASIVKEPILGGILSPTLQILMERDNDDDENKGKGSSNHPRTSTSSSFAPVLTVQSTSYCCVGGLCCEHDFDIRDANSGNTVGRMAKQQQQQPQTSSSNTTPQSLVELVSETNAWTLTFANNPSADQKAALLASMHLVEYWLFEGEGDCSARSMATQNSLACKLCTLYCCGCLLPCGCRRYGRCCWCPML